MAFFMIGCWFFGLSWSGVISELAHGERDWVVRLARASFAVGLVGLLLVVVLLFAVSNSNPDPSNQPDRGGWWVFSLACATPVVVIAAGGVLPAYRGVARRLGLLVATAIAVGFLVLAQLAFRRAYTHLDGLALQVHREHLLVIAAALLPALVLTLSEVAARRGSSAPPAEAAVLR